ncbi:MAG: dihydroorotate dehydrogenase electron transfer subunit [Pseudomonadota bacterium]
MMIDQITEVAFNHKIAPDTFLMGLRSRDVKAWAKPGQFVMVRVREGVDPLLRRPFSVCGVREDGLLLILYRVVGMGTSIMAETREGERLWVLGPLGQGFELPKGDQTALLVAGGIGMAPLFFLAQALKTRNNPFQFMVGFRSSTEIIPIGQVVGHPIELSIATDDGTEGHAGPVTDLLTEYLDQHERDIGSVSVYTCGPLPMLKKVAALVADRNIPCQVSLEAAMACGLGACQGCAVKSSHAEKRDYYHVCKDGPVFPVQNIEWKDI